MISCFRRRHDISGWAVWSAVTQSKCVMQCLYSVSQNFPSQMSTLYISKGGFRGFQLSSRKLNRNRCFDCLARYFCRQQDLSNKYRKSITMLTEINRKIPIWERDLSCIGFCGCIVMYEAEKHAALFSFSTASTTVTGLVRHESATCAFPRRERKTHKREKNFHLCCGEENNFVMSCFACLY